MIARLVLGQGKALRAQRTVPGRVAAPAVQNVVIEQLLTSWQLIEELRDQQPPGAPPVLHAAAARHRYLLCQYGNLGPSQPT
jgi:hypothetical protein